MEPTGQPRGAQSDARADREAEEQVITIECDRCVEPGPQCRNCVVGVLLGWPPDLREDERAALDALAEGGLGPRLRLVSVEPGRSGAA